MQYFVLVLGSVGNKVICVLLNVINSLRIILGFTFQVRSKFIVYWPKKIVLYRF